MSVKVGEHSATTIGGFHSAAPISATFTYRDLLETFNCVLVRRAEERAGGSGDGVRVSRNLSTGLASFKWAVLGFYNFVVSVIGLPSKDCPMKGFGRARKRLDRRLAAFLLEEASIEGSDRLKITHETIANHLGSHREVITRMLRYFQNEGMVRLSRGVIEITDADKLEETIGH